MMDFIKQTEVFKTLDKSILNETIFSKDECWDTFPSNKEGDIFANDQPWPTEHHPKSVEIFPSSTYLPVSNGEWIDEVGNSVWNPDDDFVPLKANPDNLTWGELKEKYDINGISFEDGDPDFSEVMKDEVKIDNFTTERNMNFPQADEKLAEKWECTPREVANWRKENGYTWHECKDCQTMQLVPSEVHNNIPHEGGISVAKKQLVTTK
ncbi:HNH endonuclease [Psychrobacter sp. NG254]|uniref:HNH endonuclease signature motif containing protein n=1 Tax=Psychrobacter sp. NG254 TaxID=2782003 RepID=UPI0018873D2E|nr:HNH endonuclease [Psychrobacter sp. NG254]MBF2719672.1 HNH endonuclease [Psychrobacter sp. NG254]